MSIVYLGVIAVTLLLLWSTWGRRVTPAEVLKYRVEKQSRKAEPEMALVNGSALTSYRGSTLGLLGFTSIGVAVWAWELIAPLLSAPTWDAKGYRLICDAAAGTMILLLVLVGTGATLVQLFMDVDARGIHRPRWGGRDFIPWSAVTEVSIANTSKVTVLEVRAGQRRVLLTLEFFRNPAALLELIRRHVPADRLRDI